MNIHLYNIHLSIQYSLLLLLFFIIIYYSQYNSPVKVDFEWNPYYDQEGTIASIDKPSVSSKDSCVQGKPRLHYNY